MPRSKNKQYEKLSQYDIWHIVGIDLSTKNTGYAVASVDLHNDTICYRSATLVDIPTRFKKRPKRTRSRAIGNYLRGVLEQDLGLMESIYMVNSIVAYELPFSGKNTRGLLTLGEAGGNALADLVSFWEASGELDARLMLIEPAILKKLGTANKYHPFTSGNGQADKTLIAQNMQSVFELSDADMQTLTTLQKPRSVETVYDATDALGLTYSAFLIMRALYHGAESLPRQAPKGLKAFYTEYRQSWGF